MVKDGIPHFSKEDIFYSFYGALFIGLIFVLGRNIIEIANIMDVSHAIAIVIATSILSSIEIYYVGYVRVHDKKHRCFSEFWAKRFVSNYIISIITALFLIYLYNVDFLLGTPANIAKAVIAVSMPCSLGATLSDLVRKIKF